MHSTAIIAVKPLSFPWATMDPFLFCVYHKDLYPEGNEGLGPKASLEGRNIGQDFTVKDGWRMYHGDRVPGFPGHPHRGFETVTVVKQGRVDHADSLGGAGRYGEGDVQWMTAGKGVQHSEMFPLLHQDRNNTLELFQIWINLPGKNKMVSPHYQMLWREKNPNYLFKDDTEKRTTINVIVGSIEGASPLAPPPNSWASDPNNHVAIWTISMEAGACWRMPPSEEGINRTLYYYEGDSLEIEGQSIPLNHRIELRSDVEVALQSGAKTTKMLLLQGRPIGEPVAQQGPFVMNTSAELQQTFEDYQKDHFGGWPWPSPEPTHPSHKGRFAKHADGREETPDK